MLGENLDCCEIQTPWLDIQGFSGLSQREQEELLATPKAPIQYDLMCQPQGTVCLMMMNKHRVQILPFSFEINQTGACTQLL